MLRAIAFALLLSGSGQALAQEVPELSFDPETCSYGPAFDAAFADLQREQEAQLKQRGYLYRHPDLEAGEETVISRPFPGRYGPLTVTAIAVDYDERYVYLAEDSEQVLAQAEKAGIAREGAMIETETVLDNAANIFSTADYGYDEATGKTGVFYDKRGHSGIGCAISSGLRLAREAGMTPQEFAQFRPDTKVWSGAMAKLYQQALDARGQGDYDAAFDAAQQIVALLDRKRATDGMEYAWAIDTLGLALSELGRKREALAIFERARDIAASRLGARHPLVIGIQAHYAETLNQVKPGDQQAWWQISFVGYYYNEYFGESDQRTLTAADVEGEATVDLVLTGREQMLDLEDARYTLQRALDLSTSSKGESAALTASIRQSLALVLAEQGEMREALTLMHSTLKQRADEFGMEHPLTLQTFSAEADILLRIPAMRKRALVPARLLSSKMLERRDTLASAPRDEAQRAREVAQQRRDFHKLAEVAWWVARDGDKDPDEMREEAFLALQDSMEGTADRAVALTAARRVAEAAGAGIGQLAAERQALADEWSLIEQASTRLLAQSGAEERRSILSRRRGDIEQRMARIDERLRRDAPAYFAFTRPRSLTLAAAQAMLGPDEAVLLAVPTRYGTHMMAVSHDGIAWHRSALDEAALGQHVTRLLWDVGANVDVSPAQTREWEQQGEGAYPFDRGTAFLLYTELVAPLDAVLKGKEHVLVAASGSLSSLPLALLVTQAPHGADGDPAALRATHWLADDHALVQIPSLAALKALRDSADEQGDAANGAFKGFGDPVLGGQGVERGGNRVARRSGGGTAPVRAYFSRLTRSGEPLLADVDRLRSLARLPGTAREIAALGSAFGAGSGDIFTEGRATESNLRALDLSHVGILALATHGLVAGEVDGYSEPGLVFTPPQQATPGDDGLLTTSEIAALDMNAEWVILSACNTAGGNGEEGAPGLSGLARAFFYAGARNLLASHWPVRDDIAPRITVRTVELRRANPRLSRAQAFAQALREVRMDPQADSASDTWAHPSAWAPFVLVGDR
jgi:CHAT domain-containing protein/tetratricopeptide (TPR) repeat protein